MSFQSEAKIVRDEMQPLGRRYISLRHCVQLFSPLGFVKTWDVLAAMTGLKENESNASAVLVHAVDMLSEWRRLHMHREAAHRTYVQGMVKLGLPKSLAGKLNR